jgi:hypothetical protein
VLSAAEVSAAAEKVSADVPGYIGCVVLVLILGAVFWWLAS